MIRHMFLVLTLLGLFPAMSQAEERLVRVYAPDRLVETGLLRFTLPRFSLKTQVQVELVTDIANADLLLGEEGHVLFQGAGQVWHMKVQSPDHPGTARLADWLTSDIGRRTVLSFSPDGNALFTAPERESPEVAPLLLEGDPAFGHEVALAKCIRCHSVDEETRMAGIGSTPSFSVLRSLPDWQARFSSFYALNPHPSFTIIEGVTPPFDPERPAPIIPLRLSLDEVEAILAYAATLEPADLGAPLEHQ